MKLFKLAVLCFWLICIFFIFSASISNEIVYSNKKYKKTIAAIVPQGWGFFTKSPKEQTYVCYKFYKGAYVPVTLANFSAGNLFGLSRKSRVVGYETSMLLEKIAGIPGWNNGKGEHHLLHKPAATYPLRIEKHLNHFENGKYLFIRYYTIPWAWNGQGQEKNRPYEYLEIELETIHDNV